MKKIYVLVSICFGIIQFAFSQNPGRNESLVIINTSFSLGLDLVEVEVNGKKELTLGDKSSASLVVKNGNHTLTFRSLNGYLRNTPVQQKNITISLNSQQQEIEVKLGAFHSVSVRTKKPTAITGTSPAISDKSDVDIEDAISKICEALIDELPRNSKIAVLSISSRDRELVTYTIDELEFQLVDSRKFTVVDRKTLDSIRAEQNFQLSGDVDDSSAVSIGKLLGATIVITGSITGTGSRQRITAKALDVQTAQIVTMAREQF